MPHSYPYGKEVAARFFVERIPQWCRILDVGPGIGTYADLLAPHGYTLDAVEICGPYVQAYDLDKKYRHVTVGDVRAMNLSDYDVVILGDVLEHLSVADAYGVLARCRVAMVAVPYLCPQSSVTMELNGATVVNPHEAHVQDDLSPLVMAVRYPSLGVIWSNHCYGYYSNLRWVGYPDAWRVIPFSGGAV